MLGKGEYGISNEVIEGCRSKDKECQKIVYETLYKAMYATCLRYSKNRDEAKDLLHDGFIKLFKKVDSYNGTSEFYVWAKRLFTNNCIDYVRSAYKKYIHYFDEIYSTETAETEVEINTENEISQGEVFNAMNELRPDYRLVLNLYAIEKLSHAEISGLLNIKEASSRSKLARARKALKKLLSID